jgi:hypothetical protein
MHIFSLLGPSIFSLEILPFDSCSITFQKEERNGEELSALDLFKATQNSTKNGFSETAKIAIVSHFKCWSCTSALKIVGNAQGYLLFVSASLIHCFCKHLIETCAFLV